MAYHTFKQTRAAIEREPGMTPARAAAITAVAGRKKYGAAKFNHAAATGTSLRNATSMKHKKTRHHSAIAAYVKGSMNG